MLLSLELCYGLKPHQYKISQRQHWVSKPFLCIFSLCLLLAEQQSTIFFLSSSLPFVASLPWHPSQLQLSLRCCQLKQCFSLPTKYFSYLYLLSAPSFFFFFNSSRNSMLIRASLLPCQLSAQWSGLVLSSEEVLLEGQQALVGPFGFPSRGLWVNWIKTRVPSSLVTLFNCPVRYIFLSKK